MLAVACGARSSHASSTTREARPETHWKVLADKKRNKRILRRKRRRRGRTPFEIVQVVVVRGEVEGQQVTTSRG